MDEKGMGLWRRGPARSDANLIDVVQRHMVHFQIRRDEKRMLRRRGHVD